jgi:hypothetical protein
LNHFHKTIFTYQNNPEGKFPYTLLLAWKGKVLKTGIDFPIAHLQDSAAEYKQL